MLEAQIAQLQAQLTEKSLNASTFNERLGQVQNELLVVMLDRNKLRGEVESLKQALKASEASKGGDQ